VLYLGKKRLDINEVLDRWYGPDHSYFKVRAEDQNIYIVRYNLFDDEWQLVFFKESTTVFEFPPGVWRHAAWS
jgi:hypothetical protein